MAKIAEAFMADHAACDDLFALCEHALNAKNVEDASMHFRAFHDALLAHFSAEEETIFPAFEARSGMRSGPTVVMRDEHAQMRSLSGHIHSALLAPDLATAAKLCDTLFSLMQSHNMKEEQILYPMCDAALAADTDTITLGISRLTGIKAAT